MLCASVLFIISKHRLLEVLAMSRGQSIIFPVYLEKRESVCHVKVRSSDQTRYQQLAIGLFCRTLARASGRDFRARGTYNSQ